MYVKITSDQKLTSLSGFNCWHQLLKGEKDKSFFRVAEAQLLSP